jgi:hypothetical protein
MTEYFNFHRKSDNSYIFVEKGKEKSIFLFPGDGMTRTISDTNYDKEIEVIKGMKYICLEEKKKGGGSDDINLIKTVNEDNVEQFMDYIEKSIVDEDSEINGQGILGFIIEAGAVSIFKKARHDLRWNLHKVDSQKKEQSSYTPQKNKENMYEILKISGGIF